MVVVVVVGIVAVCVFMVDVGELFEADEAERCVSLRFAVDTEM